MASSKSEKNELDRLNAVPTKNSGRGQHNKGDGIIYYSGEPLLTVDVKEYKLGFRITPEVWAKVNTDAKINGTKPCLFLVLGDSEPKTRLIVVAEDIFEELMRED